VQRQPECGEGNEAKEKKVRESNMQRRVELRGPDKSGGGGVSLPKRPAVVKKRLGGKKSG